MKTQIWSLPDEVLTDVIARSEQRKASGIDPKERERLFQQDQERAIQEHGFLDPLFNPQLQGELF